MNAWLKFLFLAVCLIGLSVQADSSLIEGNGPITLTDYQMDTVTAGGIFVVAEAFAGSLSTPGFAFTDTKTLVNNGRYVDIAIGRATAIACCGPQTVTGISLSGGGNGKIVSITTKTFTRETPEYNITKGIIVVVSYNPPSVSQVRENRDRTGRHRIRSRYEKHSFRAMKSDAKARSPR